MRLRTGLLLSIGLTALLAVGCGDGGNKGTDGGAGGDGDGGSGGSDGGGGGGECVPGTTQCSNCVDDDDDGLIDGFDPHCAGPEDNDEASFATDIPGDNQDPKSQDCFFDGNSGKDNPCDQIPTCCLLGPGDGPTDFCPPTGEEGSEMFGTYPGEAECQALFQCYGENADNIVCPAPVGCDCFSCCTVCNPDSEEEQCADIYIGPGSPAECDPEDIGEATMDDCLPCTKVAECGGGECNDDPEDCILCPGQTEDDLPDSCTMNECPGGETPCDSDGDCALGEYCSVGCCINEVD